MESGRRKFRSRSRSRNRCRARSRSMSVSRVRIKIESITMSRYQMINPFWLLIDFENAPLIRDVERKITSILNRSGSRSRRSQCRSSFMAEDSDRRGERHLQDFDSNVHVPIKFFEKYGTTTKKGDPRERLFSTENSNKGEHEISTCQLWMEGYVLLSGESSKILENGDVISVRPIWDLMKEKDDGNNSLTDSIQPETGQLKNSIFDTREDHQDSIDSIMTDEVAETKDTILSKKKKSVKRKRERQDSSLYENTWEKTLKQKSRKGEKSEVIKNTSESPCENKRVDSQKNIPSDQDESSKEQKRYHSDAAKQYEHFVDDFEIMALIDQKVVNLTENLKNSGATAINENEEKSDDVSLKEIMPCDGTKRKRRRKRKRKANDSLNEQETVAQVSDINKRQRSHTLNLLTDHQPKNKRLTFESDSSSDKEVDCSEDKQLNGQKQSLASVPSTPPNQDKKTQRNESEMLFGTLSSNDMTERQGVDKTAFRNYTDLSVPDSLSKLPFTEGQSLDPNSKFDELFQRCRMMNNNCSVAPLCNGGHVFTREKKSTRYQHNTPTVDESMVSLQQKSSLVHASEAIPNGKRSPLAKSTPSPIPQMSLPDSKPPADLVELEVTPLYLDVAKCKPLTGTPQAGDIIAYKVLELSEDYTPIMSDFKQGQVISKDEGMITVELFENSVSKKRTGRFELEFDEEEENGDAENNIVSLEFLQMVDVRLVQRCQSKTQ